MDPVRRQVQRIPGLQNDLHRGLARLGDVRKVLQTNKMSGLCLRLHRRLTLPEDKRSFILSFPCVCPEPVLVKYSFLYINGAKRPFSLTARRGVNWGGYSNPLRWQAGRGGISSPHAPEACVIERSESADSFIGGGGVSQLIVLSVSLTHLHEQVVNQVVMRLCGHPFR